MLRYLKDVAKSLFFDNATNGFAATDVQDAIEEARNTATGRIRFTLVGLQNGTVLNNSFIGYSELISGSDVPFLFPRAVQLKEVTLANVNTACVYDIKFRKNSVSNTPFFTWAVNTDGIKSAYVTGRSDPFAAGDYLTVQATKVSGNSLSDLALVLYFEVT